MSADNALWQKTATELAAAYANGETDPVAVLESCLGRHAAINGVLNAVVTMDPAGAREAAEQSRVRWQRGEARSCLDGIPVTVKDNIFVAGLRASWGSRLYETCVPKEDDEPVRRLRAAGAVILGKTNTPELSLASFTSNPLFGSTGNPWDPRLSPGGSSGGAVAAVAGGIAPLALATDAGGSTRRPGSHTGCVALKTSNGYVPRGAGFPALAADFQTIGVIARSAQDIRSVLTCIAGSSAPGQGAGSALRVAAFCDIAGWPLEEDVRKSYEITVQRLAELGHKRTMIEAPYDPEEINRLFGLIAAAGVARAVQGFSGWRERVTAPIAGLAETGAHISAVDYLDALDAAMVLRRRLASLFGVYDFLLTPTAAALPWCRDEPYPKEINGQEASPRASAIFTTFVNIAGLAAINIPSAPSETGLPIGVQLVGPVGSEEGLIGLAGSLEQRFPWSRLAPL